MTSVQNFSLQITAGRSLNDARRVHAHVNEAAF